MTRQWKQKEWSISARANKSMQQQSPNSNQCPSMQWSVKTRANVFNMEAYGMVEMILSIRDNMRKKGKLIVKWQILEILGLYRKQHK